MFKNIVNTLKSKLAVGTVISIVMLGVLCTLLSMSHTIHVLREESCTYKNNEKALVKENDSLKNQSLVYQLTVEQLGYFNDSVSRKLQNAVSELNIQRKNLKQLQYIKNVTTIDTLFVEHRDTIFINQGFLLDTVVTDNEWYSVDIGLRYPNLVNVRPRFVNEFIVVTAAKKEYVDNPKKFFLCRWFQKKHTVLETVVKDNNPYSEVENSRFINIVK